MGNLTNDIRKQAVQLAKAMSPSYVKAKNIQQALLQFVGTDSPIAFDDNYKEYVEKGYQTLCVVYTSVFTR